MSHMGKSSCKLTGRVNLPLLEAALKRAATEVLGEPVKMQKNIVVTAMDRSSKNCLFGFKNDDKFHYGLGVAVDDNNVVFYGDSYPDEKNHAAIIQKTQQQYILLALALFAQNNGMSIDTARVSTSEEVFVVLSN